MTDLIKRHLENLVQIEQATTIDIIQQNDSQILINIQYPDGSNKLRTLTFLG